jgi:diguanylate cyclase (GGDEF)-like protein
MEANAELQRLASTDPLTGLLNRRRFEELALAEIDRALRYARPLSLLLIDLDHFKRVNDTYGHAVGDVTLKEAARRLLVAVRSTDRVARYGGEELAVLLPETPAAEAQELAERLRRTIGGLPINHEGLDVRVTASLGVASFQAADGDIAHLINRADAALYVAKQQGRDRVVFASDVPAAPMAAG